MKVQHDMRALARGTELSGYVIDGVIGHGGSGITYCATRRADAGRVAIREYAPRLGALRQDDDAVVPWSAGDGNDFDHNRQRFRHEARLLRALRHPNVARAQALFAANRTDYMVMDDYDGRSLADLLDDPVRIDEAEVRAIIEAVCEALRYLHGHGVIHRDLKPEHIIVRPDGAPLLIDFGAAVSTVAPASVDPRAITSPGYSPFEIYACDIIAQGPWTDLYALGAILYRLLSGARPMDAPSRRRHLEATGVDPLVTAAQRLAGRYSESLLAAIDLALALYPQARPASVSAWRRALT